VLAKYSSYWVLLDSSQLFIIQLPRPLNVPFNNRLIGFYLPHKAGISVATSINSPVWEDVLLTIQFKRTIPLPSKFKDHSNLRFPWSIISPLTSICVTWLAETVNIAFIYNLCWTKYSHRLLMERILTERVKRFFEWSSNWTVIKTSSRTGQLMLVGTDFALMISSFDMVFTMEFFFVFCVFLGGKLRQSMSERGGTRWGPLYSWGEQLINLKVSHDLEARIIYSFSWSNLYNDILSNSCWIPVALLWTSRRA